MMLTKSKMQITTGPKFFPLEMNTDVDCEDDGDSGQEWTQVSRKPNAKGKTKLIHGQRTIDTTNTDLKKGEQ